MDLPPYFEESTSPLYFSNDGLLRIVYWYPDGYAAPRAIVVLRHTEPHSDQDGAPVFATRVREHADAYIAGYDAAREG